MESTVMHKNLLNPNRTLGFLFAVRHREILMTDLGLKSMYVYWNIPVPISVDVFDNEVIQNSTLYIPKGTYDNYWLTNWGVFDNIVEFDVTGIDETATTGEVKETSRYSVNVQLLCMPIKGLNLVKYSDGVVKKVVVR